MYTPPCLWHRKIALDRLAAKERLHNSRLRTQIRLGQSDIELWTKEKHEAFYTKIPTEAFGPLPPIGTRDPQQIAPVPPPGRSPPPNNNKRKPTSPPQQHPVKRGRDDSPTEDNDTLLKELNKEIIEEGN